MKTIQKIKAWRYPCDNKMYFDISNILCIKRMVAPMETEESLAKTECLCGKFCKPQQIEIKVRAL